MNGFESIHALLYAVVALGSLIFLRYVSAILVGVLKVLVILLCGLAALNYTSQAVASLDNSSFDGPLKAGAEWAKWIEAETTQQIAVYEGRFGIGQSKDARGRLGSVDGTPLQLSKQDARPVRRAVSSAKLKRVAEDSPFAAAVE